MILISVFFQQILFVKFIFISFPFDIIFLEMRNLIFFLKSKIIQEIIKSL